MLNNGLLSHENIQNDVSQSSKTLPDHDSSSNENELPLSTIETKQSSAVTASSDVETEISDDQSPSGRPSSISATLQHQSSTEINEIPCNERIAFELNSVALDWRSYRTPFQCMCALPMDSAQRKVNFDS